MAQRIEHICDLCGKITRTKEQQGTRGFDNKEVAKDNWDISIYSHWAEQCANMADFLEWKSEREYHADACADCAKKAAEVLRLAFTFDGKER